MQAARAVLARSRVPARRAHGASSSTNSAPAQRQPPPPPTDREPEYPFMLVNPRARLGDAAPLLTVLALYFAYCAFSDVRDAYQPPEPEASANESQARPALRASLVRRRPSLSL